MAIKFTFKDQVLLSPAMFTIKKYELIYTKILLCYNILIYIKKSLLF